MSWVRTASGVVSTLVLAAVIASCGGGGGDSDNGAAPDSASDEVPTATTADDGTTDEETADVAATDDEADNESDGEPEDGSDDASGSVDTTSCEAIFSMAEMEEFFAEPVELTEETNDSLGQLVCTWESIEDPDDMEDLASQTLFVQFYSGSPIEGSAFIDPTIFDSVTTIDGVGDLAYTPDATPNDFYFVDGPVGGSLSYFAFDMGEAEAEPLHTPADVEQLFRTFHERVT